MSCPADSAAARRSWVIGPGFLGAALAGGCRAAGDAVLTLGPQGADVPGDASQPGVLREALGRMVPDVVFCCAATHGGSVGDYRRCYPELVRAVCAVTRARVVFCSSSSVYGGVDGSVADEGAACLATGQRALLLLEAERLVLEAGGSVARLVPMYGPGRFELLRRHLAGEPRLPGDDGRLLNYVHRDDAVRALRLMAAAASGVYNVSHDCLTLGEAYAMLEELTGVPRSALSSPVSCRGRSSRRVVAGRLAALGWYPRWCVRDFVCEAMSRGEVRG